MGCQDVLQVSRARAWHMQVLHKHELGHPSSPDEVLELQRSGLDFLGSKDRGTSWPALAHLPFSPLSSLTANLLHDQGAQAIAVAVRENHALTSLQ